jgi:U3 small nucleolar RNA-associated protein 4
LPSFPQSAQALSFDPTHPSLLILAFPDSTLQIYDVESRQFPVWAKELCNNLPKRFTNAHDPILGIRFDPAVAEPPSTTSIPTPRYALFWGSTWICKIKLDNPNVGGVSSKKRRRESLKVSAPIPTQRLEEDPPQDFKMVTHYRPILFVDFLAAGELVVVERPLVDVLATLPPAYFQHKYGTS